MVAVIVYNGEIKWNPLRAKLYAKYPDYFHDIGYPFKIEMINVGKEVGNIDFSKLNPYVALTLVAMKYVFNAEKYKPLMDKAMAHFLDPKNKIDDSFDAFGVRGYGSIIKINKFIFAISPCTLLSKKFCYT